VKDRRKGRLSRQ